MTSCIPCFTGSSAPSPAPLHFGYAEDIVTMPLQGSTQRDGIAHIFYDQKIHNGYCTNTVLAGGASRCGIELSCDSVVGRRVLAGDRSGYMNQASNPGHSFGTLDWIRCVQCAALACDNYAPEVRPSEVAGIRLPFHHVAIRDMGLLPGELFNFEDLSTACAVDGTYAFLFTGSSLPITGAVGSPLNPLAIK